MKKAAKYISIFFSGLIILLLLILAFTQTGIFKNWLKGYAQDKINESLDATVKIGSLGGSLFKSLTLSEITIIRNNDTLAFIPKITARYDALKALVGRIEIDLISIDSPYVNLRQTTDGSWNLAQMTKPAPEQKEQEKKKEDQGQFGYLVNLDNFLLNNADIRIQTSDSIFPGRVKNFNIAASAKYRHDKIEFTLEEFNFKAVNPDLTLERIALSLTNKNGTADINDLIIKTLHNQINGNITIQHADSILITGDIQSEPLYLSEFDFIVPSGIMAAHPDLNLDFEYQSDTLVAQITLEDESQSLVTNLNLDNPSQPESYLIRTEINQIDLKHWLGDPAMDFVLNGQLNLDGQGFSPADADVNFDLNLYESLIRDRKVGELRLSGNYDRGDAQIDLNGSGQFGHIAVNGSIDDVTDEQIYSLNIELDSLDLSRVVQDTGLQSNLNMIIAADGRGFDFQNPDANLNMQIEPSSFNDIRIRESYADFHADSSGFDFDTLHLALEPVILDMGGFVGLDSSVDVNYRAEIDDVTSLANYLGLENFLAEGTIEGTLSGQPDSLVTDSRVNLQNLVLMDNTIASVEGDVEGNLGADLFKIDADIRAEGINVAGFNLDFAEIQSEYAGNQADFDILLSYQDSIKLQMVGDLSMDTAQTIGLDSINIELGDYVWSGGSDTTSVIVGDAIYSVRNFRLSNQDTDTIQYIHIDGDLDFDGQQNLNLDITDLQLARLTTLLQLQDDIKGNLNLTARLTGDAEDPLLDISSNVSNGYVNDFKFNSFDADIDYRENRMNLDIMLLPREEDSISVKGFIPAQLSIPPQDEIILVSEPMEIDIHSEKLPLFVIEIVEPRMEAIKGQIITDLKITGTLNNPLINGNFSLQNGAFRDPVYGLDYSGIYAGAKFDGQEFTLDSLVMRREDGFLRARGTMVFANGILSGDIESSDFSLNADNFWLVRHQHYEVKLSADANIEGNLSEPKFGGNITVHRSSFYVPALTDQPAQAPSQKDKPMLAKALEDQTPASDTLPSGRPKKQKEQKESPDLVKNLQGRFKVSLPRNTWLRSPDMRLEIAGELDLVKETENFEIFGTIRVVRGHYDLYGKRFQIEEGMLTFQGGSEINPMVDLTAVYVFRTADRKKRNLKLHASGQATQPELNFTLDGNDITEGDAVAYILFGRSLDQLTYGERAGITGDGEEQGTGAMAGGILANMLAGQLSQALGSELNLDLIEIKAGSDWKNASFLVGKYITTDLFVSYQRGLGRGSDDEESVRDIVTLEYELFRNLFLQLTEGDAKASGFDLIYKFDIGNF